MTFEAKKSWDRKGRGGAPKIKKPTLEIRRLKKILKSGSDVKIEGKTLRWMDSLIQTH